MGTTTEEARRLRELCEKYELENREILAKYTDEHLAAIYNGIGPEAFPQWLRAALDAVHPSLAPVAFIHDVEWHESDARRSRSRRATSASAGTESRSPAPPSGGGGHADTR